MKPSGVLSVFALFSLLLFTIPAVSCGFEANAQRLGLEGVILDNLSFLVCLLNLCADSAVPVKSPDGVEVQVTPSCETDPNCRSEGAEMTATGPDERRLKIEKREGDDAAKFWTWWMFPPSFPSTRERRSHERSSFIIGPEGSEATYLIRFEMVPTKRFVLPKNNFVFATLQLPEDTEQTSPQ